jgi:hypothetical protein
MSSGKGIIRPSVQRRSLSGGGTRRTQRQTPGPVSGHQGSPIPVSSHSSFSVATYTTARSRSSTTPASVATPTPAYRPIRSQRSTQNNSRPSIPRGVHPTIEEQDQQDSHPTSDPDADALNEVVMAVDLQERGTVGCAYYVAREERLYFMEDVKLGGVEVVDACELRRSESRRLRANTQT